MLLPKTIKDLLEKSSIYMYVRYGTALYNLWMFTRSDVRKSNRLKQNLYKQLLPETYKLIIDVGANEGMLTTIFSRFSKRVIAVEPSTRNITILNAKFSNKKCIVILPFAVSYTNGEQIWYEDKNDYAMGTLSRKWNEIKTNNKKESALFIKTITLDSLIEKYGVPDYIKIDVEGNEWQVMKGLSIKVPLLSFEAILPQFFPETKETIQHLSSVHPAAVFNFTIDDVLFYNEFKSKENILTHISTLTHTIDIFCRML